MNTVLKILLTCISVFCISLYADAPVWKISKDSNHIYVAGTMHILSKDDYPLKNEFKHAFLNSDEIVFEADLSKAQTPELQKFIYEKSLYKNGKTIKDFLTHKTYNSLYSYIKSKNMSENILKMKPGFIISSISLRLYSEYGFNVAGVDSFIEKQAINNNKDRAYLETLKEQIEFLSRMGVGNEEDFIKYTLSDIKKASVQIPLLHRAWKNGNVKLLDEKFIVDFKATFPKAYNILIVNRNNNWVPKIEKMFNSKEIEYVLVGFLHLAGEDSVLSKLEKLGYKIEKLKVNH